MHAISALALASLLIGSGAAHFVFPRWFRTLVPSWPRLLAGQAGPVVAVSGVADLAVGAALCVPAGREAGGWAAAVLITAYLPAHVDALRASRRARPARSARPARPVQPARLARSTRSAWALAPLAVNLGYIGWAVTVATTAR